MAIKTDKLAVSVYALHGDTCGLAPHCKSLGCASGFDSTDWVLSAKFAYLQEAIDYAEAVSKRGVRVRLVSRIMPCAGLRVRVRPNGAQIMSDKLNSGYQRWMLASPRAYRFVMRLAHRYDWHHAPVHGPIMPNGTYQRWCRWCGLREILSAAEGERLSAKRSHT
jgi:hypothetical protein